MTGGIQEPTLSAGSRLSVTALSLRSTSLCIVVP